MSWAFLAAFVATGLAAPSVGAALVIAFLLYYILRVAHNTFFLTLSFARVRAEERSDWLARLDDLFAAASPPRPRREVGGRLASRVHEDVVRSCRAAGASLPPLSGLVHVVIVPICNEKREVYEQGICAMADGVLDPATFLIVVLAVEERCGQEVREHAEAVRREYAHRFRDFLLLVHPAGLEGEIPGKGSNAGHAARQMAGYLGERSIEFADVLLIRVDADALVSPQYFACLSYYFLAEPGRTRACFQPLAVFSNNIWRVPAFVRVVEMGATVFQLIDSSNMDVLVTFSCYSYSYLALAESGYWPRDVIAEDAAVFWKTFLHYRGDFRAVPLPVTVGMDAAEGPTFWKTLTSMYRQKLRGRTGRRTSPSSSEASSATAPLPAGGDGRPCSSSWTTASRQPPSPSRSPF